jgi:uncharacterized protein YpmB
MAERDSSPSVHDPSSQQSQPASFASGTYVVQVPKDQIYRVPPPENAIIAERHRNPLRSNNNKKKSSCSCCLCVFIIVIVVILIIGIIAGILYVLFNPKDPTFHVEGIAVKNSHSRTDYGITITAKNPNTIVGIYYKEGAVATLSFKQKEIAKGKYPTFYQDHKNSTVFVIDFRGSNVVLPKKIEKSMKTQKPKVHVNLSLKMDVPIRWRIGSLNTGSTEFVVACDFTVDKLAKDTRIVSQTCHTKRQV